MASRLTLLKLLVISMLSMVLCVLTSLISTSLPKRLIPHNNLYHLHWKMCSTNGLTILVALPVPLVNGPFVLVPNIFTQTTNGLAKTGYTTSSNDIPTLSSPRVLALTLNVPRHLTILWSTSILTNLQGLLKNTASPLRTSIIWMKRDVSGAAGRRLARGSICTHGGSMQGTSIKVRTLSLLRSLRLFAQMVQSLNQALSFQAHPVGRSAACVRH